MIGNLSAGKQALVGFIVLGAIVAVMITFF